MRGQTSVPGIFAAGDATITPYKQIIIAMGEGSKAALSAFDYLIRQAPAVAADDASNDNKSFEVARVARVTGVAQAA
jgi:alkyl hydroperoxide reductase subunit F